MGFVLGVAADGTVTDCTVRESSGSADLDVQTCRLLQSRARFEPAINDKGEAITGTWASTVRWEIPQTTPLQPPASLVYRFVVEKNGEVSSCQVLESSKESAAEALCNGSRELILLPSVGENGLPVRTEVTVTMKNEHRILPD